MQLPLAAQRQRRQSRYKLDDINTIRLQLFNRETNRRKIRRYTR